MIRLCTRLAELKRVVDACAPCPDDEMDALTAATWEQERPLVERIVGLHAGTVAGWTARARALAILDPDLMRDDPAAGDRERMVASLVRDLLHCIIA